MFPLKLLGLPTDLLGSLIFSWFDTKSIVCLDSSICSRTERPAFLCLLKSNHAILPILPANDLYADTMIGSLQWATDRNVKCRTLHIGPHVRYDILDRYLRKTSSVENMHLIGVDNAMGVCLMVAAHCRALSSVYFHNCCCKEAYWIRSILSYCATLTGIYFYQCTDLSAEIFAGVSCPLLETLALLECGCDDQCMTAAVNMNRNIVNLTIGDNNLSDAAVRDAVANLPLLNNLVLSGLNLSDQTIHSIAVACKYLIAIDLFSYGSALTDAAVVSLVTGCKQLEQLHLPVGDAFTTAALSAIAANCPRLEKLLIGEIIGITLQDEISLLNSCNQLQSLGMRFSFPASAAYIPASVTTLILMADNTTDALLGAVSQRCTNLAELIIWYQGPLDSLNRAYTAKGLAAIAKGCTRLRRLVLVDDAAQIPEIALLLWRNTCPRLEVLNTFRDWEYELFAPPGCTF